MAQPEATVDKAMVELQDDLDAEAAVLAVDADRWAQLHAGEGGDLSWLPEWYLKKLVEHEAARQAIKEHSAKLLAQVDARDNALKWKWGQKVEVQVNKDLQVQGGKKRSVQYATGRAGYRKVAGGEKVLVDDEDVAMKHAAKSCPAAIKVERRILPSELKKLLKDTGEVLPGTHIETTASEDRFYAGKQTFHPKRLTGERDESNRITAAKFFADPKEGDAQP